MTDSIEESPDIEALKPCPFCGGDDLDFGSLNAITCRDCTGSVCPELDLAMSEAEAQVFVVAAWNARAIAPNQPDAHAAVLTAQRSAGTLPPDEPIPNQDPDHAE